jgi:hypothetical protein
MRKRLIPTYILIAYSAIVIRLLVVKNVLFEVGPLTFRFTTDVG